MRTRRLPHQKLNLRRAGRTGFTLIEVLLVVAILGIIAAAVVPSLIGRQKQAYADQTRNDIRGLESALTMYAVDHDGTYPSGGRESLNSLTQPSEYRGKKLSAYIAETPKDAWGEQLYYEYPTSKAVKGEKPAIWSSGENRQNEDGSGDDINNWTDR
jgi:general secretion pathway protein G